MNKSNRVINAIGKPAMLEQTAEEAVELAQACLKYARYLRKENPTPKSLEEIKENFFEEIADIEICIDELSSILDREKIEDVKGYKRLRTDCRLFGLDSDKLL